MSFPTDWDIDYYRTDYEHEEHWDLRRQFMETHKANFPEDELVCLAQVFTNVEFLGCKYPEETMRKVALLSQDVAKDFRNSRKNKLKRTFVGAADAAGAKVKGKRLTSDSSASNINTTNIDTTITDTTNIDTTITDTTNIDTTNIDTTNIDIGNITNVEPITITEAALPTFHQNNVDVAAAPQYIDYTDRFRNSYGNLILYEPLNNDVPDEQKNFQNLHNSTMKQKVKMYVDYRTIDNLTICSIKVNNFLIAEVSDDTKKGARIKASEIAIKKLKETCYTIKKTSDAESKSIESRSSSTNITRLSDQACASEVSTSSSNSRITEKNIGYKMLKMLGWKGGALNSSGIEEPISVQIKVDRKGLGLKTNAANANDKEFKAYFHDYLRQYSEDNDKVYQLVFSKDYTKEERATLHEISRKYGLKSNSKNTENGDRYLVVSKKISFAHLANDILNKGIYSDIYELIPPTIQPKLTQ